MSRNTCCVAMCKNIAKNTQKQPGVRISYFTFPKDEKLKEKWIYQCRRADPFRTTHARICSIHFAENQFQEDIQARLMGYSRPRKLKPGAIPTLFLRKSEVLDIQKNQNDIIDEVEQTDKRQGEPLELKDEETYDKLDIDNGEEEYCDSCQLVLIENKRLKKLNNSLQVQIKKLENQLEKFKNSRVKKKSGKNM